MSEPAYTFRATPMADPFCRRDRPAPVARGWAAGMGGGVATAPSNARGGGAARLAQLDAPAVGQHQRFLGCALNAGKSLALR